MPTQIDRMRALGGRLSLFARIVRRQAEGGRLKFCPAWKVAGICNDPKDYERRRAWRNIPRVDDFAVIEDITKSTALARPWEE